MRLHFYITLLLVIALFLATGCATYTGCNEPFFENLPGCPAKPVKLDGCRIHA
ncbi:MAG: hypothetical protein OEQ39_00055 [Gammaproteobacteria bacterium]|nr:hypothetical protein [Gammaproteobacteria bacterium]